MITAHIESDSFSGSRAIGCGLIAPNAVTGTIKDDAVPGMSVNMEASYDRVLRRFTPTWVKVTRNGSDEIGIATLQKLKIRSYCAVLLKNSLEIAELSETGLVISRDYEPWAGSLTESELSELISAGPSSQKTLLWVGRVYRVAEVISDNPAKHVERIFKISHATASRWIAKAKKNVPDWYGDEMQKRLPEGNIAEMSDQTKQKLETAFFGE